MSCACNLNGEDTKQMQNSGGEAAWNTEKLGDGS
jgi:hypothetical protein